jgi:hypothetical protein
MHYPCSHRSGKEEVAAQTPDDDKQSRSDVASITHVSYFDALIEWWSMCFLLWLLLLLLLG